MSPQGQGLCCGPPVFPVPGVEWVLSKHWGERVEWLCEGPALRPHLPPTFRASPLLMGIPVKAGHRRAQNVLYGLWVALAALF